MATRRDFKLCCAASRLLFNLMCCLEMEQIYAETVSNTQQEKYLVKKPSFVLLISPTKLAMLKVFMPRQQP